MIARSSAAYKRLSVWAAHNPVTLAFTAVGIGAVAVFLAVSALYFTDQVGQRVTKVERSVCTRAPQSQACAEVRLRVAKAEPLRNPCASFQRVTSRRGRNCEQFYVPRTPRQFQASPNLGDGEAGSPDSPSPVETPSAPDHPTGGGGGGLAPGKGGSDDDPAPGSGGGDGPAAPVANPPGTAPTTVENPPAEQPLAEPDPAPERGPVETVGKAVDDTLKGAGETVGGALEGVEEAGCKLLGTCRP